MTKTGHSLTGFFAAAASLALPITQHHADLAALGTLPPWLVAAGILFGSNAPDWLEIAWFDPASMRRKSVIEHRTWTHWVLPWLALAGFTFWQAFFFAKGSFPEVVLPALWFFFGFSLGGLCHLLVDWPNPTGVPILGPLRRHRHSLNLWRSSEKIWLIVLIFASAAGWMHYELWSPYLKH